MEFAILYPFLSSNCLALLLFITASPVYFSISNLACLAIFPPFKATILFLFNPVGCCFLDISAV
ncbi:MAG: hypothetical protein Rpha_2094 [Candidatus Ruthia sp. Apha_13_S6]|nr:hypothetical protein [Candidatus Ruthia sp. Apha_13_S6]